jgi:phosphopantothenoylcysteine synthetase/decarboxylase
VGSPLALIVCGAPLAARTPDIAEAAVSAGWEVSVTATKAALAWLDEARIVDSTGQPLRTEQRPPDQPKPPRPAAVLVSPATFNTVNKMAAGIADNPACSLLCECVGAGIPIVAVPMVNERLWSHPAWGASLVQLQAAGVTFLDIRTGRSDLGPVPSGTGAEVVARFDPSWAMSALPSPV